MKTIHPIAQQTVILSKTSQTIQTESGVVLKIMKVNPHPLCLKPGFFSLSVLRQDVQQLHIKSMSCIQVFSQQLAVLKSLYQLLNRKQTYASVHQKNDGSHLGT